MGDRLNRSNIIPPLAQLNQCFLDYRLLNVKCFCPIFRDMNVALLKCLGGKIRALRKAQGISQERLAELAELHPTYISDIERGKVNASIGVYDSMAQALGVPLSELVDMSEVKQREEDSLIVLFQQVKALDGQHREFFVETAKGILAGIRTMKR